MSKFDATAALAAIKARRDALKALSLPDVVQVQELQHVPKYFTRLGMPLNAKQSEAVDLASSGKSFCLIGPAGSGKTTTLMEVVTAVLQEARGTVLLVSFTNRAVANIRKAVEPIGAAKYCSTIHSALEYAPTYKEYFDNQGRVKRTRIFEPRRNAENPLRDVTLVVVDEASMVPYADLYRKLKEACPNATFIFVGDLNQIKPVFGDAVLGHKLNSVPVVELTEIYRQAMDSPIVGFQHKFTLAGKVPTNSELQKYTEQGALKFVPMRRDRSDGESIAFRIFDSYFIPLILSGEYRPDQDVILIPQNEGLGQKTFNLLIAQYLGRQRNAVVHEIRGRIKIYYYAIGDLVQYAKRDAEIISIEPNPRYFGACCKPASTTLDRWGNDHNGEDFNFDDLFSGVLMPNYHAAPPQLGDILEGDESSASSHIIKVRYLEDSSQDTIKSTSELETLQYNYAMTVHRSQGSEWRKVWLIFHQIHNKMLTRELLYTGMTRAKEALTVLYTPESRLGAADSTLHVAIGRQSIPGKTWKEKAVHFFDKLKTSEWVDEDDKVH